MEEILGRCERGRVLKRRLTMVGVFLFLWAFFSGLLWLAGALAKFVQAQELPQVRTLARADIVFCRSDAAVAPISVFIEGPFDEVVRSEVEGEIPIETDCTFVNSYVGSVEIEGELLLWRNEKQEIERILYTAIVRDGRTVYSVADFASATGWQGNGARYTFQSELGFDERGTAFRYAIDFLRNASDVLRIRVPDWHELAGDLPADGILVPHPDPATVMKLKRAVDGGQVVFELDYRGTSKI